jgi:hypothetical protein
MDDHPLYAGDFGYDSLIEVIRARKCFVQRLAVVKQGLQLRLRQAVTVAEANAV